MVLNISMLNIIAKSGKIVKLHFKSGGWTVPMKITYVQGDRVYFETVENKISGYFAIKAFNRIATV